MKRTIITTSIILATVAANAQGENFDPFKDRQFIFDSTNICAVLLVIYMLSSFILKMVKQNFDYRIKNRIIDKGTPENIAREVLQPGDAGTKTNPLYQWIFVLAAVGTGFTIINLTRPFGLHSLAIMAFSIAAGLGGYLYFKKRQA